MRRPGYGLRQRRRGRDNARVFLPRGTFLSDRPTKKDLDPGGYLAEIGSKTGQDAIWQAISKAGISAGYASAPDGGGIGYIWIGAHRVNGNGWVWNGACQNGTFSMFWFGSQTGIAVGGSYVSKK